MQHKDTLADQSSRLRNMERIMDSHIKDYDKIQELHDKDMASFKTMSSETNGNINKLVVAVEVLINESKHSKSNAEDLKQQNRDIGLKIDTVLTTQTQMREIIASHSTQLSALEPRVDHLYSMLEQAFKRSVIALLTIVLTLGGVIYKLVVEDINNTAIPNALIIKTKDKPDA